MDLRSKQINYHGNSMEHIKNNISDTCDGCLWDGFCGGSLPCCDYSPVDENSDREDEYIATRRFEFNQDWNKYIKEWN